MKVSENEIVKLTGLAPKTVRSRLEKLTWEPGPNRAKMYESTEALPLCYTSAPAIAQDEKLSLTEARTRESTAKAIGAEIDNETKLKQRIPLTVFQPEIDALFGSIAATIKQSPLPERDKEEIRSALRDAPSKLKW